MPAAPESALWLFAGPNGAGKSTFIESATAYGGELEGIAVLNPDRLTKRLLRIAGYEDYVVPEEIYRACFVQAATEMEQAASAKVCAQETVCIETVLSTDKYLRLVQTAKEAELPFYLVYVFVDSPELSCERVARRVREGGHPVPTAKIIERYHRSLWNLPIFASLADRFWVYDNSDSKTSRGPKLVAEGSAKQPLIRVSDEATWLPTLFAKVLGK